MGYFYSRQVCYSHPSSYPSAAAAAAAAAAKSLQSCPTLCDPIDGSPPGSPHPWDSLGKSTGVGCYCLLRVIRLKDPLSLE